MALVDQPLYSLNAGEISRLALTRVDLTKLRIACERQSNWLPHVLGPTMVRPGTKFLDTTASNAAGWFGEFYFDENTKALLVLTTGAMQVMLNDAYISRVAVASAVTNGGFDADISGWTDSDEAGAASTWAGGHAILTGTGTTYAFLDQQITVAGGDISKEHALRLVVAHGYVSLQVGSVIGNGGYWDIQDLTPGSYSLAFTPTGDFWIRIGSKTIYPSHVDSINVEAAGTMSLPVPWTTTTHFDTLRYDQSGDVLFCACSGFQQRRIERRASNSRSWAVALYQADDGPFRLGNVSDSIQITPSGTSGAISLTASRSLFKSTHVGALFKLTHPSQTVTAALAVLNAVTGSIRVSGLASHSGSASSRSFTVLVEGTFVATITLQRSIGSPGSWTPVENYVGPTSKTFDDGLDNQIIYYRLICSAYTSGSATSTLIYNSSSQTGIVRIGTFSSVTSVTADVLSELGGTTATSDWAEGEWSDYRGWPAAVALDGGRLDWGAGIKAQHSVSDAFASYDATVEGDSGPINKTVVVGGNDGIRWMLSLQRLLAGSASVVMSIRASAFDEPLTPTAYVAKVCSDDGAAKVRPLRLGKVGVFAGAASRLFKLVFAVSEGDYETQAIDRLKPEMFSAGIRDIAAQRKPDNANLWVPLGDGTAVCVAENPKDEVEAMVPIITDGAIERVAVLPGTDEDDVYFLIKRTIGGVDKRYVEKLAKRSECVGGTLSKTVDSHVVYSGPAVTTITGLSHLEGKSVVVWGKGATGVGAPQVTADAMKVVSGGQITGLPVALTDAVVGLPYTAQIKTAKLAYGAEHGTALSMQKRVARVGLVMADTAWKGVRVGRDFTNMTGLPVTYRGKALTAGQVLTAFDAVPGSFNGGWDADARVCIEVKSPYCATIMGLAIEMTTNEPDDAPPKEQHG